MFLSNETAYVIRALAYLASAPRDRYTPISQLARELKLPTPFLSKILQKAVKHGWLESSRGARGGVRYACSPAELRLIDVVEKLGDGAGLEECPLKLPGCIKNGQDEHCILHADWAGIRNQVIQLLTNRTFADFIENPQKIERELMGSVPENKPK